MRVTRRLLGIALTLLAASNATWADSRLAEEHGVLSRSVWGVFAGLGAYNPSAGTPASSSGAMMAGLRYVRTDHEDDQFHSIGYELSATSQSSSTEDILMVDGGVNFYYPKSHLFQFDHHLFWGAFVGTATVSRSHIATIDVPIGGLTGGVQGRIRDFYVEALIKYIGSGPNASFHVDGSILGVQATYFFNP